ncbi:MAG: lysozyme [Caulobacteraceae bacterium]|nr:lysozyme [Caulobacteraceae bacterium]
MNSTIKFARDFLWWQMDLTTLIKHFEGFSSKPYLCPAGHWTIGYGSTWDIAGQPVTKSTPEISQDDGDQLLLRDILQRRAQVLRMCPPASKNQLHLDALTSFCHNLGSGRLMASTLRRYYNQEKFDLAANQFLRWSFSGGRKLPGLLRRRHAEKFLFLGQLGALQSALRGVITEDS